jgi:hypothetical protein
MAQDGFDLTQTTPVLGWASSKPERAKMRLVKRKNIVTRKIFRVRALALSSSAPFLDGDTAYATWTFISDFGVKKLRHSLSLCVSLRSNMQFLSFLFRMYDNCNNL